MPSHHISLKPAMPNAEIACEFSNVRGQVSSIYRRCSATLHHADRVGEIQSWIPERGGVFGLGTVRLRGDGCEESMVRIGLGMRWKRWRGSLNSHDMLSTRNLGYEELGGDVELALE